MAVKNSELELLNKKYSQLLCDTDRMKVELMQELNKSGAMSRNEMTLLKTRVCELENENVTFKFLTLL